MCKYTYVCVCMHVCMYVRIERETERERERERNHILCSYMDPVRFILRSVDFNKTPSANLA